MIIRHGPRRHVVYIGRMKWGHGGHRRLPQRSMSADLSPPEPIPPVKMLFEQHFDACTGLFIAGRRADEMYEIPAADFRVIKIITRTPTVI